MVKWKSANVEYYEHINDFNSWTKVDLTELDEALFHNPSNDPHGSNFYLSLENRLRRKFDGMKMLIHL